MDKDSITNMYPDFVHQFNIKWNSSLSDDDVKKLSLNILDEVDKFCKINNINYSLAYGTLLGAVRHKGYIPWDDDIDLMMLRSDYDKFIKEFPHGDKTLYSVACFESDFNFRLPFAKIVCNATINNILGYTEYGHGIDLFPIDKIPEGKPGGRILRCQNFFWWVFMLKSIKWSRNRGLFKNIVAIIVKVFLFFVPYSILHRLMRGVALKYANLTDNYNLGCLFGPYGVREIMSKEIFIKTCPYQFENSFYFGLVKSDQYLRNLYGDYLKLPPEEKRITHHDFKVKWI